MINTKDLPKYCEYCGKELIIKKKFPPMKKGYNCNTKEPLYSQTGIKLNCPDSDECNKHSYFSFISPDLGATWQGSYYLDLKNDMEKYLVNDKSEYYKPKYKEKK